ncbi:MAG: stage II sporulation protein P [Clostridia bacterium]|nr:stage II sporulation protein P [Clostridia bacterium]MBQ6614140.1 stage II sporulation protein P [Clostridia bacterium]
MQKHLYNDETGGVRPVAALPPPSGNTVKRRRIYIQNLISVICATFAIATLVLCGLEKIDEVNKKGVVNTVAERLLKDLSPISEATFGSPLVTDKSVFSNNSGYLTLPRIYYVPKESIIDNSLIKAKELEKKMYELYSFDYSKVQNNTYPILPTDLSASSITHLKNDTTYNVDMDSVLIEASSIEAEIITDAPLVLIVHTHGTESFSEKGSVCYNDNINIPRSEDVSKNIVAVGKTLAEALNKKGIPTIHCETMHDKESYIAAYDRSAESIRYYLEKYPSIKYVFDVHRDSLIRSDLTKLRPVTLHGDAPCAQIMMIVGSSEKSGIDYDWQANLVLATGIQKNLYEDTLGVARQLYLRGATYNQQYAKYGLLLEIGSCGNSLAEAKNAAKAFADAFEKVIK